MGTLVDYYDNMVQNVPLAILYLFVKTKEMFGFVSVNK